MSSPAVASPVPSSAASWIAVGTLIIAIVAVYFNSFRVPFIYDDVPAVSGNPSIQQLWPLWTALDPPPNLTTSGRPIVNLSLALNYALGGIDVGGYHAFNVAVHVLAALALFGVVRRTLRLPLLRERFGPAATWIAFAVAALWSLHPLQTESVTYIVQRAESLVGLFYLLTLYCFIRAAEAADEVAPSYALAVVWAVLCVVACMLGMASKEVMASAPLAVLLYDRSFITGTFAAAWRRRRVFYVTLFLSWVVLGLLVLSTGGTRDGSAGFGQGMAWWTYALTQTEAIVLYLWLSIVPRPLIFDYGSATMASFTAALPYSAVVGVVLGAVAISFKRWPAIGFLGFCFFAILAPSSSIVPVVTETMAEHRMYLPLAAVMTLIVMGLYAWLGRKSAVILMIAAFGLGFATVRRNLVYQSQISIWSDTVAKIPTNGRAHNQLGSALTAAGREAEAFPRYAEALRLQPNDAKAHFNFATALFRAGRPAESLEQFETTLRLQPNNDDAQTNYGLALMQLGRRTEAIAHYRAALQIDPTSAPAHNNLGVALGSSGELKAAVFHFQAALRERPDYAEAHNNLGRAWAESGQWAAAIPEFQAALQLYPNYAEAHLNAAKAFDAIDRPRDAVPHYREVTRLEPSYADGHDLLGRALLEIGQRTEAIAEFKATLRLAPGHADATRQLAAQPQTPPARVSAEGATP